MNIHTYVYIYIYTCVDIHVCINILQDYSHDLMTLVLQRVRTRDNVTVRRPFGAALRPKSGFPELGRRRREVFGNSPSFGFPASCAQADDS